MTDLKNMDHKTLFHHTKSLVADLKRKEIELVVCLKEIRSRKLHVMSGCPNLADFCVRFLGLSEDQAWKKSQIANVLIFFPEVLGLLESGKTHLTHIGLIASQITQANSVAIFDFLPGKTSRQVQTFLSQIDSEGRICAKEPEIEITLKLPLHVIEQLERAQRLLQKGQKRIKRSDVIKAALEAFLDKRDPVRKAQRAKAREIKKPTVATCSDATGISTVKNSGLTRYIPATIRHEVFNSQLQRCSFESPDGHRCTETANLQIDHKLMWSLGGDHRPENLRLMCPAHNRFVAAEILGHEFMDQWAH